MSTAQKTPPLPTPRAARQAAGLSPIDLAAATRCSLALVYRCEKAGTYPRQAALRAAYLAALGLPPAPAKPKPKAPRRAGVAP